MEEVSTKEKYKRKIVLTGTLRDAYRFYKKLHPDSKIGRAAYVNICCEFNKRLSHSIITKSIDFRGFYRLGFFGIRCYKRDLVLKDNKSNRQKNPIDWNKTMALWNKEYPGKTIEELRLIPDKRFVYFLNEHTNGYVFGWKWDRTVCNIPNQTAYMFKPVKGGVTPDGFYYGRKGLSAWVKSEDRDNEYLLR